MDIKRRLRALASGKSPSIEVMKRTYNRAVQNGGVTQDFSANIENIREISRKLGYNILPYNTSILETRKNLLNYSEDYSNVAWSKGNVTIGLYVIANPINGDMTASSVTPTAVNGFHNNQQNRTASGIVINGNTYTYSVYLLKKGYNVAYLRLTNGLASDRVAGVDLIAKTISTPAGNSSYASISTTIQVLPNDWVRASITFTYVGSDTNFNPSIDVNSTVQYVGDGVSGIYMYGAQIESGSTATTYQAIDSGVINRSFTNANFLYVPSSYGEGKNFAQVQNKRNLLQWSEDYTNALWLKTRATITSNNIIGPTGILNGSKMVSTVSAGSHYIQQVTVSTVIGDIFNVKCFAKAGEYSGLWIETGDSGGSGFFDSFFNLTAGTISGSNHLNVVMKDVGNGWYECSISRTTAQINTFQVIIAMTVDGTPSTTNFAGNGTSGIYIAGTQLERGLISTSYQKTVASGDGIVDFNFVRATSSTVTNKLGVIEDSCYNLLQRSEEFDNAYWIKNNTTISANSIIAPNGTLTADKLIATSVNGYHDTQVIVPLKNSYFTWSVFIKSAGLNSSIVQLADNATDQVTLVIDLITGTPTLVQPTTSNIFTNISYAITVLANGWFNASLTVFRTNNGNANIVPHVYAGSSSFSGNGVDGVYIWGAQLVQGSTPRPYLRTTNRLNVPRLDYSNNQVRRNLLNYSEQFDNAYWNKVGSSVGINSTISPDNLITSEKLIEDTGGGPHYIALVSNINGILSGINYTYSIYVKSSGRTRVRLQFNASAVPLTGVDFRLDNETVAVINGSPISTNLSNVGNGWYRCSISILTTSASYLNPICILVNNTTSIYTGDGISGIYIWGAQLETGTTVTTYQRSTDTVNLNLEPSLLIEPQRTNLLLQSSDFTQSQWVKLTAGGLTTTTYTGTRPDGTDGIIFRITIPSASTNVLNFIYQDTTTARQNSPFDFSIYIKRVSGGTQVGLSQQRAQGNPITDGNIQTVKTITDTWVRYDLAGNSIATGNYGLTIGFDGRITTQQNLSSIIIDVWGAQFEVGSNATTYIPTTTATVIRNGETSYVDLYNNAMLNKTNWTLYYEGYLYDGVATLPSLCLSDTSAASSNTNQIGWTGKLQPFYNIANVRTNGANGSINNAFNKLAIQYNNGIASFWINGSNVNPNRTIAVFDYRYLALNNGGSTFTTDKIALFNRTLTDAECSGLTNNISSLFTTNAFISTWNTNNTSAGSSATNQIRLPLVSNGTYNMIVDWGDNTFSSISVYNQSETTHTYAVAGTYQIKIYGTCSGWGFGNTGDRGKIITVQTWGILKLPTTTGVGFLYGCSNLNLTAVSDVLDLTTCTSLSTSFQAMGITTVNRMNEWNVSNITSLYQCFANSTSFNQNIDNWNVGNVTDMRQAIYNCQAFNQNIGSWDMSKVTTMYYMFYNCTNFNNGGSSSINNWNTLNVTDMSLVFQNCSSFNQPIGNWNTSKVTTVSMMFNAATNFNQNLHGWNLLLCTNFSNMLQNATNFNNGLPSGSGGTMTWTLNTASTISMVYIFQGATSFNQDIGAWNVSKVNNFNNAFNGASKFNNGGSTSIGSWDTSSLAIATSMFSNAVLFNQPLSWNLPLCTDFTYMFNNATAFNNGQASGVGSAMIWTINTATTSNMTSMFVNDTAFNANLNSWDVSMVNNMSNMFQNASKFNQPITSWVTSNVTNMSNMFSGAILYNQNMNGWDVSKVTIFSGMFNTSNPSFNNGQAPGISSVMQWTINTATSVVMNSMFISCINFNGDVSGWNVSKVTNFSYMFAYNSKFNQPIGGWDTSSATIMNNMFDGSGQVMIFNQNIGNWNISNVTNFSNFMFNATAAKFSTANLDAIYNGWGSRPVKSGITITFGTAKYTAGASAGKAILVSSGWTISDGGI